MSDRRPVRALVVRPCAAPYVTEIEGPRGNVDVAAAEIIGGRITPVDIGEAVMLVDRDKRGRLNALATFLVSERGRASVMNARITGTTVIVGVARGRAVDVPGETLTWVRGLLDSGPAPRPASRPGGGRA